MNWTAPFHGVSHFGDISDMRWATVCEYESGALARFLLKGHWFSSPSKWYESASAARAAGEAWAINGTLPDVEE